MNERTAFSRRARLITAALCLLPACGGNDPAVLAPVVMDEPVPSGFTLLARLAHLSDAQAIDEESPARFAPLDGVVAPAWRPQEAYSVQLLEGMIRAVNREHRSGRRVDFVLHTADAADNNQLNEWRWFLQAFDGGIIDPLSGTDDRVQANLPAAQLDPHRPFAAEGLYRQGLHGQLPTIPWYSVLGNHDHFALGNFQIFELPGGKRIAPVPVPLILGALFPTALDPTGTIGFGLVSPAHPGPPPSVLNLGRLAAGNADRHYCTTREILELHQQTATTPAGHGFDSSAPQRSWYSAAPVPGLRLIVLDTSRPAHQLPGLPYVAGSIQADQVAFLKQELELAEQRGEWIIVASHHPSQDLATILGTALTAAELRDLLSGHEGVLLHLVGHTHRNRVADQGVYLEIETGSTLDWPQEGRIIELWESPAGDEVLVRYRMLSHMPDAQADRDELFDLRAEALALALQDAPRAAAAAAAQCDDSQSPSGGSTELRSAHDAQHSAMQYLAGQPDDREGGRMLQRRRR
jgi:hypothetical protein